MTVLFYFGKCMKCKTIEELTKEELFEFYNKVRSTERYTFDGSLYNNPNIDLLDEINYMVMEMEKRVESFDIDEPPMTIINMITAICVMEDQDCYIKEVRHIENNEESINSFEEEMDEMMGLYGYRFCYFTEIMPIVLDAIETYRWMDVNKKYEIDR